MKVYYTTPQNSILPDVSAPFKQLFPDLRKVDKRFEAVCGAHFGSWNGKVSRMHPRGLASAVHESAQILPNRGWTLKIHTTSDRRR